jgi:hypothetical protein
MAPLTAESGDQSGLIQAGGNAGLIEVRGEISGEDGATGETSGIVPVDGQLKSLIVVGGLTNASVLGRR